MQKTKTTKPAKATKAHPNQKKFGPNPTPTPKLNKAQQAAVTKAGEAHKVAVKAQAEANKAKVARDKALIALAEKLPNHGVVARATGVPRHIVTHAVDRSKPKTLATAGA